MDAAAAIAISSLFDYRSGEGFSIADVCLKSDKAEQEEQYTGSDIAVGFTQPSSSYQNCGH